jgi:hypothetical protein
MDMQQVAQITQHLEEATAAIRQTGGDLLPTTIKQLDTATRETLNAIYRAREALKLPAISDPSALQSASYGVAAFPPPKLPRRSRLTARAGATKRATSDKIARSNDAFFQQMNLSPVLDAVQQEQEGTETIAQ